MTVKKYNHIHKYRRDKYSTGRAFYFCVNGDCNFKIEVRHSLGKNTLCNKCGGIFTMNEYSIRAAKPICMNCVSRKSNSNSAVNLSDIGVNLDAINVVRNTSTTRNSISEQTSSVSMLEKELNHLVFKEYNPEDESDDL